MDYLICCEIWRRSVFLSVFNYMLNTRVSQWCKQIKLKENTCLFISTKLLRKTNKSPNHEPYVVLVSYTLWCFSFFISEAVLLSLEERLPFVLCFGGGVSLNLAETVRKFGLCRKLQHPTQVIQLLRLFTDCSETVIQVIYGCPLPELQPACLLPALVTPANQKYKEGQQQ